MRAASPTPGARSLPYLAAVAGVVVALGVREGLVSVLGPGVPPYSMVYPVILLASLLGGIGPGLCSVAASVLAISYWVLPPGHRLQLPDPGQLAGLALFVSVAVTICAAAEWHRRTRLRASALAEQVASQEAQAVLRATESRLRDEAQRALEREKTIFQALLNGARNSHLVYLDRDFNFVHVNEPYAATCGYTPEAMVGLNHFALYPSDENEAIFRRVRDTGVPAEFRDKPFVFPDQPDRGVTYWDWTLRPVKSGNGTVEGLVFSLVETTDRKRGEDAIIQADRRKSEFLATLSHELRNPLAPIRYALELLDREPAAEDRAHARDVIGRQLRHLVRLVDDLLDITRIASNKLQLRRRVVALDTVIQQAVESAAPNIGQAGHRFVTGPTPANAWIDADFDRLVQVVTNLLNNAAKFTPAGGRVALAAEADDREVVIRVSDDGIGLREEDRALVFDMFTQVHEAGQAGLGIGLALVKGTVELHGGSVTVHSDGPGCGCEFVVRLPRVQAPATAATPAAPAAVGPRRRVLVVDDNADAAQMMATLLELQGHEVRVAHDGSGALAAAAAFAPEIGLFDIGMPVMDGYELARRVRELDATRGAFLVAVTGWGQDEDRQRSRAHGFDAHLTKPADPAAIERLLASLAGRSTPT